MIPPDDLLDIHEGTVNIIDYLQQFPPKSALEMILNAYVNLVAHLTKDQDDGEVKYLLEITFDNIRFGTFVALKQFREDRRIKELEKNNDTTK